MKIWVLVENTSECSVGSAHGLSLYAETHEHRILFDAGPDGALLLQNADALQIDLNAVDIAILSHGHYDHAGGLCSFLRINDHAPVYLHRLAAQPYYAAESSGYRYIGIAPELKTAFAERLIQTEAVFQISDSLTCFSDIRTSDLISGSNGTLLEKIDGEYLPDRFLHEQNLLIYEGEKLILIAGCAHRGIVNIIRRAADISGKIPDAVFAGFHLTNPSHGTDEPADFVRSVVKELSALPCRYYTGHCTGDGPFAILKEELGDRLQHLHGGCVYEE